MLSDQERILSSKNKSLKEAFREVLNSYELIFFSCKKRFCNSL